MKECLSMNVKYSKLTELGISWILCFFLCTNFASFLQSFGKSFITGTSYSVFAKINFFAKNKYENLIFWKKTFAKMSIIVTLFLKF